MKKKNKTITLTVEEELKRNEEKYVKEMNEKISLGMIPKNPTRVFEIAERVCFGNHEESYVREVYNDGLFYRIETFNRVRLNAHAPSARPEFSKSSIHYVEWFKLYKYNSVKDTKFSKDEKFHISQFNSGIESLLHNVYFFGVDFDVEYQREHVWEYEDKVALIDSIFNNIDIGKFILVERDLKHNGIFYEIIDGKQRLTTLCEFYEDRFKYNGFYFSELSNYDKHKFLNHSIVYGVLRNPTTEMIYETFIKFNTCGKPMDKKHIEKVKAMLEDLKKD